MTPRWGVPIPASESIGFPNERCIEIPLGIEAVEIEKPGLVLDAGCGLNRHLPAAEASFIHVTQNLQSEKATLYAGRRSYVNADLRNLRLFTSRAFERTACISTLEHVGFDNTTYGGPVEHDPESMFHALHELCRVTKRILLLSVPFHPSYAACEAWRYLTPEDLAAMQTLVGVYDFTSEIRYYGKTHEQRWYGGTETPVETSEAGFPTKVNAIAVMRCVRE